MEAVAKKGNFANRVLRDMNSGVLVVDTSGKIIFYNEPAAKMLEIPSYNEDISERIFDGLKDTAENDEFVEFLLQSIYKKNEVHTGNCKYVSPSGTEYSFKMSSSYLKTEEDETAQIVVTLDDETDKEKLLVKIKDSTNSFTIVLIGLCFWLILFAAWLYSGKPFPRNYLTKGIDLLGLIILLFILMFTSLTLRDIGIKPNDVKKTFLTSIVIVLILFALMAGTKIILLQIKPTMFKGKPFIDLSRFTVHYIEYISTSLLQEFLARGGIQSNFKRITNAKHKTFMAIFMASIIFAVLHIHLGLVYMIGAAVLSAVLGILYNKQDNLVGVWMVHYSFGVFGALLNFI